MQLNELVVGYRELATRTGEPVALTDFGLPKEELERELAAFDEDYQISRFLQFTQEAEAPAEAVFTVNGEPCTHLRILPGIDSLL